MNWTILVSRIAIVSAALTACAHHQEETQAASLAITGVDIVDVESGALRENQTIIITGNRIVEIVPANEFMPTDARRLIDGRGKYATPGLWDMHSHMVSAEPPLSWDMYDPEADEDEQRKTYMPLQVAFGVTGVRELSGGAWSLKLREKLNNGELLGPQLVVGSPLLDGPFPLFPGSNVRAIADPAQARSTVEEMHRLGYDFLKTYQFLSPKSYRAIHESAQRLGIEVAGELPISISLWEAAELGHRSVEHLTGVEIACSGREDELRATYSTAVENIAANSSSENRLKIWNRGEWEPVQSIDPDKCSRLYAHLVKHGVWVVPTLVIQRIISYPDIPQVRANVHNKYLHKYDTNVTGFIEQFDPDRRLRPTYDHRFKSVADLHAAGVGIMAGSDIPGGFPLHEELEIFVEAGLSPAEALRTATINPAKYLGRENEIGSIAPGKIADIVLLHADPLSDIRNTQSIASVFLQGRYLDRAMLDRFLRQAELDARAWENE